LCDAQCALAGNQTIIFWYPNIKQASTIMFVSFLITCNYFLKGRILVRFGRFGLRHFNETPAQENSKQLTILENWHI